MRLPPQLAQLPLTFTMSSINAHEALGACKDLEFQTVLDVGSGDGAHAAYFMSLGKDVTTCDMKEEADYVGRYTSIKMPQQYDLIWCSHVLEHQQNVSTFLKKIAIDLKKGGYFVVTVPPLKHDIVGGHVSLWNAGLLLYNLILAGFDCSKAKIKEYGYNISVIVRYNPIKLPKLKMDYGDIETLAEYFPFPVRNGFDGRIQEFNW